MALMLTKEAILKRKDENRAEAAAIRKVSDPIRAERDKLVAQIQPIEAKIRELNEDIKDEEDGLYDLEMEYANIMRMLPGTQSIEAEGGVIEAKQPTPTPQTTAAPAKA